MNILNYVDKRVKRFQAKRERAPGGEIGLVNNSAWMSRWGGWDPNPDEVIAAKGMAYLREIERDTHLTSVYQYRRQNIISRGWTISAAKGDADEKIAEFVRWNLVTHLGRRSSNGFDGDIVGFMDAVGRGFSLSELVWETLTEGRHAGKTALAAIKKKDAEDYGFTCDKYGNVLSDGIVYHGGYTGGVERLPRNKFVHVIYGPDDDNAYGEPVSSKVAFWVWLKKNAAKFWGIFSEKFSMPLAVGEFPNNAKDEDKATLQSFIENLQSMAGIKIPEGFKLSFLEAVRRGDVTYDNFIERCNKEISKIAIGATLGIEEGSKGGGSYAHANVNMSVMDIYTFFDEIMIAQAVNNQVIRRLIDYNFLGVEEYPSFSFNRNQLAELVSISQGLEGMARMGVEVPVDWIYNRAGIPKPKAGEAVTKTPANPAPTEPTGVDNRQKQNYIFSENRVVSSIEKRGQLSQFEKVLDALEINGTNQAASIIDQVFAQVTGTLQKKLTEGAQITDTPRYAVNVGELKNLLAAAALQHHLTARYFAEKEVRKAGVSFAETDIPLEIGTLEAAIKKFTGLIAMTRAQVQEVAALYEKRCFTVAGLVQIDIEKIFETVLLGLREGWNMEDFAAAVNAAKIKYTGQVYGADQTGTPIGANHLKTIFRSNMMRAWRDGRDALYNDPDVSDYIWGYTYSAILDGRERPSHGKLDGVTRAKDDPFWQKYNPPWDFNCRCQRFAVMKADIAEGVATPTQNSEMPEMNIAEGF